MYQQPKSRGGLSIPQFDSQIWILAGGRLLSELGTGFTLFYAPIFFVTKVGLSATSVGIALGTASISGIAGRVCGGLWTDSPIWGRRKTLLLSAVFSAIGSTVLTATFDFVTLVIGNIIGGFGAGLYWPATEAVVADLTTPQNRREAYAITRLADNLGLGMGIILAGWLVSAGGNFRWLFAIDATSFVIFFAVIWNAIRETSQLSLGEKKHHLGWSGWRILLQDHILWVYVLVNIMFTTYISQLHSTLPIYLQRVVVSDGGRLNEGIIAGLFAVHLLMAIVVQLPVAKMLRNLSHPQTLSVSAIIWSGGFAAVWWSGWAKSGIWISGIALAIFAIALVSYTPSAAAFVSEIAPVERRGIYLSVNSLCWAVGYFIGPSLGGWAMDQTSNVISIYWLGLAATTPIAIAILTYLQRIRNMPIQKPHI
ncbi:MDR family MFS transporter [Calothrix sp. NIES-3974]|uniref:MDR family MFS transporter n=1 Tax=Calothrix sp. NIES-3974 TaxID=2005462 RepID=UPI000B6037F8|nr:MFS transporter [Calothrix sp. NIES-3974]BAZ05149.1 major facilitator transporter [Calothrix sp. NIES-3974]